MWPHFHVHGRLWFFIVEFVPTYHSSLHAFWLFVGEGMGMLKFQVIILWFREALLLSVIRMDFMLTSQPSAFPCAMFRRTTFTQKRFSDLRITCENNLIFSGTSDSNLSGII